MRYHYMDNIRAIMMLLGLVLHSAVSFSSSPAMSSWPYRDPMTSDILRALVLWIHTYRMHIFFLASGFFFILLIERRTVLGMLKNRFSRIVLPMIAFWFLVYPLTSSGFLFGTSIDQANPWATVSAFFSQPWDMSLPQMAHLEDFEKRTYGEFGLIHLWFLYHLAWYCLIGGAVFALFRTLANYMKISTTSMGSKLRDWSLKLLTQPIALGLIVAFGLLIDKKPYFATSDRLIPNLETFVLYGLFFAIGALLYKSQSHISKMTMRANRYFTLGLIGFGLYFFFILNIGALIKNPDQQLLGMGVKEVFLVICILAGLVTSYFVYAFIGLFKKTTDRPSGLWSYALQSSYGIYILQLPFTIWIPVLLRDFNAPGLLKFSITLSLTTLATLLLYNYLIRPTAIGVLLNGKRYPAVPFHKLWWKEPAHVVFDKAYLAPVSQ